VCWGDESFYFIKKKKKKKKKKPAAAKSPHHFNTFINKTDASVSDVLTYHKLVQSL